MNQCFKSPVVETATGGKGGVGARISEFGRGLLHCYRAMEDKAAQAVTASMETFFGMLAAPPHAKPPD